jgi:hypothetical protein
MEFDKHTEFEVTKDTEYNTLKEKQRLHSFAAGIEDD